MSKIPGFTREGLLPAGDYEVTLEELRNSVLIFGEPDHDDSWDEKWRTGLVDNLGVLVRQLWEVGITEIYIDGSFAEDKAHPNDIDGYFECDRDLFKTGELSRKLNTLDPHKIWTWDPNSRRAYHGYPKKQLPMWHTYRVELYPHFPGQLCGIPDKYGNELEFPSAFRRSRQSGSPRGIIKIGFEL